MDALEPENTGKEQARDTRFKPGQSGNPAGRPKGARSKLGEDFIDALAKHFASHGAVAISEMCEKRPGEFVKVLASILPKELDVNANVSLGAVLDELPE